MTLTPNIIASLSAAGIGAIYHERAFSDFPCGLGMEVWMKSNGPKLRRSGGLVVVAGIGLRDETRMMARSFHLNGAGVRIKTLPETILALRSGGERLEEMAEAPVLMLSPAQADRRGCPLDSWDMDRLMAMVRGRVENGKVVVMHWASDMAFDAPDSWWDRDFTHWLNTSGFVIDIHELKRLTAAAKRDAQE